MDATTHPAYLEEERHLKETLRRIEEEQRFMLQRNQDLEQELNRTAGDPVLYSTFNASRMNIAFNREQMENLQQAKEQAYFARLDFCESEQDPETVYLGRLGFISRQYGDVVVVDWREPIATLYYGGTEGEMSYEAPGGVIECQVSLKRQLEVERDVLRRLFDARFSQLAQDEGFELPRDELLFSRLGQQADRRLRDIVSTIQKEQNAIIRAGMERPLVLQGVAGSGKTTVALHRLAYLLYRYRDSLSPENVLILAPNRVFLTYISEVLPALGVHDVTQSTLQEYLQNVIGRDLEVLPASEKFMLFLDQSNNAYLQATRDLARQSSAVKGDLHFREVLDNLVDVAVRAALPRQPLQIAGEEVVTPVQLWERYLAEGTVAPPAKRLEAVRRYVTRLAEDFIHNQIARCEASYQRQMAALRQQRATGSRAMLKLYQQREQEVTRLREEQQGATQAYLGLFGALDPLTVYQTMVTDAPSLRQMAGKNFCRRTLEAVALLSNSMMQRGAIEPEDLAPLAYLKLRLQGVSKHVRFQHIVIDEGQDLSPLEVLVLRLIAGHASFTVVGDVSQSIQPGRGVHDWREITGGSFSGSDCRTCELTLSYRTTAEIVLFANQVLQSRHFSGQLAQPVMRSGELPYLNRVKDSDALTDRTAGIIRRALSRGYQTIAVVTRTADQARSAHALLLAQNIKAQLMQADCDDYEGGVLVMPAYLTKGLEFDVSIIYDANAQQYGDQELDAKLLYVTLTRAMHELYVLYQGEISPLLRRVGSEMHQMLK